MLNQQAQFEVGFWKGLVEQRGDDYRDFRISEYFDKTFHFDPLWVPEGTVLDVGCGCVSVLEQHPSLTACDPLMDEYRSFFPDLPAHIYKSWNAETLPCKPDTFDSVFCVNMIDHTPYPHRALEEMRRVLKPGGRLFFEVHFDDALSPAHYGLWNLEVVDRIVAPIFPKRLMHTVVRVDEHNQSQYWAVYEK